MGELTIEQRERLRMAESRALNVLKVGDRLRVKRCADVRISVTMTGWDGRWITSAMYNDIHPVHIEKVNGNPVNFSES